MWTSFNLEVAIPQPITNPQVRYVVWQKEQCPDTGRQHLQGYIELLRSSKMATVKNYFNDPTIHLEARSGNQDQAIAYCTKEDTRIEGPWELGTKASGGSQSKRNDLTTFRDSIRSGQTDEQLLDNYPGEYARYPKFVQTVRQTTKRAQATSREVQCFILWGETGCGKTRFVYDKHGYQDVFKLDLGDATTLWFDGYEDQPILLLDDFYGSIKYHTLLNYLDRYPVRLPIKGTHGYAAWHTVYITSNKSPEEWYLKSHGLGIPPALDRRITGIYHCIGTYEESTWTAIKGTLPRELVRTDDDGDESIDLSLI